MDSLLERNGPRKPLRKRVIIAGREESVRGHFEAEDKPSWDLPGP